MQIETAAIEHGELLEQYPDDPRDCSENQRRTVMNHYADCTYYGGGVMEQTIDYDDRRRKHLMVVNNVPAGVCRQCGEKYFKPDS